MIRVDRFEPADLDTIRVQAAQPELAGDRFTLALAYASAGSSFTGRIGDRIVMCGGAFASHRRHATMWSALAEDAGPAMLGLTRITKRLIARLDYDRLDTFVRPSHAAAIRWVELLGFDREARLSRWHENGEDVMVYTRVAR